jgi:hypothetical protein
MGSTLDQLTNDARTLHLATALALADRPASHRLVLVVDQAEEVFTLCRDEQERARFLENLRYAAGIPDGPCVVILTLRADFYPRCAAYPELSTRIATQQYLVSPLGDDELHSAVVEPAWRVGLQFEDGLVETILNDVARQPGSLPLLEHALLELWERRRGILMTDRPEPRFPDEFETAARVRLAEAIDRWGVGPGDLGICGAARGGDILFAEVCLDRGTNVRLCVALLQEWFLERSVRTEGTDWETRFLALVDHPLVTAEFATWPEDGDPDEAFRATNLRMIELARAAGGAEGFRVLVLWDERDDDASLGGTSSLVRLVDGIAREVAIVNPHRL